MSLSVKTQGGGGGFWPSIFVTGLSETDTVTASKDGKTINGKWVKKPNPSSVGLPDGYTQVEYLEGTGTEHIITNIANTNGLRVVCDVSVVSFQSDNYIGIWGATTGTNYNVFYASNASNDVVGWKFWISATDYKSSMTLSPGQRYHIDSCNIKNNSHLLIDGVDQGIAKSSGGTTDRSAFPICLYASVMYDTSGNVTTVQYKGNLRFHGVVEVYSSADDSAPVGFLYPAKRNSDGVLGMYNTVTGEFCTNAGTGTFLAGTEIPQHIEGHEIIIKEYGMWTVTATDGEKTTTQDVLVDVVTEFEIEMDLYKLYRMWLE